MRIRIRTRSPEKVDHIDVAPIKLRIPYRPLRTLDFDCECRPLHWIGSDYVSKEITAIAWAWVGADPQPEAVLLGEMTLPDMLQRFVEVYNHADLVTGHFIRGFDLPLVNGALTEFQMPPLGDKMSHDTKLDLLRRSGLSSSQENLGAMLGLAHPKVQMNQQRWREANRLTPEGLAIVRERVTGDVLQHIEMRARLMQLGYLRPPVLWSAQGEKPVGNYTP